MQKSDLKKVIKQLVRESLTEIFAEMRLETLVENVVKNQIRNIPEQKVSQPTPLAPKRTNNYSVKDVLNEMKDESGSHYSNVSAPAPQQQKQKRAIEKIDNDEWKNIYNDTLTHGNPILEGKSNDGVAPELVPENVLERMGLMKDYSRLIGMDDEKVTQDDEWKELREKRNKILESTIKRNS